eukprot:12038284-Alexandrium_andersonii.AAC.1
MLDDAAAGRATRHSRTHAVDGSGWPWLAILETHKLAQRTACELALPRRRASGTEDCPANCMRSEVPRQTQSWQPQDTLRRHISKLRTSA